MKKKNVPLKIASLTAVFASAFPFITSLADEIGDFSSGDPSEVIGDFNDYLTGFLVAAGLVITALGVFKLISAMADRSPMGKLQATTLIGVGILLAGSIKVLESISDAATVQNATAKDQVSPLVDIITTTTLMAGAVLVMVGVFKFVSAMANERPEEKAECGKFVAVGAVLCGASVICDSIVEKVTTDNTGKSLWDFIFSSLMTPIFLTVGGILLMTGIFSFGLAFRSEDAELKHRAAIEIAVGTLTGAAGVIVPAVLKAAGVT